MNFLKATLVSACAATLATSFIMSCSPVSSPQGSGVFKMAIAWPQTFQIQAIPLETERIEVRLNARNGEGAPITQSFTRNEANTQQRFVLTVGPWDVRVQALGGNPERVLAEAEQSIQIQPGAISRADFELTPSPEQSASPPPSNAGGSGSSGNNGSGTGTPPTNPGSASGDPDPPGSGPDGGTDPNPPDGNPSPQPSSSPDAVLLPLTPINAGNTGGGSAPTPPPSAGGTTGSNPAVTALQALPDKLSGLGFSTELRSSVNDPNSQAQASDFSWSCIDANGVSGCGSFTVGSTGHNAVWKAPNTSNGGANNQDIYTLTVTLNTGSHPETSQSTTVTVEYGTGSAGTGPTAVDGGQT